MLFQKSDKYTDVISAEYIDLIKHQMYAQAHLQSDTLQITIPNLVEWQTILYRIIDTNNITDFDLYKLILSFSQKHKLIIKNILKYFQKRLINITAVKNSAKMNLSESVNYLDDNIRQTEISETITVPQYTIYIQWNTDLLTDYQQNISQTATNSEQYNLISKLADIQSEALTDLHDKFYNVILSESKIDIYNFITKSAENNIVKNKYIFPSTALLNRLIKYEKDDKDGKQLLLYSIQLFEKELINDLSDYLSELSKKTGINTTINKTDYKVTVNEHPVIITVNNQITQLKSYQYQIYEISINLNKKTEKEVK